MANCAQRTAGMANAYGSAVSNRGWLRVNARIGITVLFFIFSAGCITGCGAVSSFNPSANHLVAAQQSQPPTFTTIYNFGAWESGDGWSPEASLVRDSAGNLYGTTEAGGSAGGGTVFRIDPSGKETVIHSFTGNDGSSPMAGLVIDPAGNFYGTTAFGGDSSADCYSYMGCGTVFKLDSSGNYSVLHSFTGNDGASPMAELVIDPAGNFYGTTAFGGATGVGTAFKIDPSGNYFLLHSFVWNDGAYPRAGLAVDTAGNLYGTTSGGGSGSQGTVFKIDPSGKYSLLHSFVGSDGSQAWAGLLMDPAGNLYGTTLWGGSSGTADGGTVFKIDPSGNFLLLHSFGGNDGAEPESGLIMDPAGSIYGTTRHGGDLATCYTGCGTVFKIDPSGLYSLLHTFDRSDGASPRAGLVMDPAATLYGTTVISTDGSSGGGSVFKIALATPFSAFDAKLNITAGPHARLQLKAAFTQDSDGGAIDPVTQGMMLALGPYTATIPAGEFHMRNKGLFLYEGTINGVALQIRILQTRANSYQAQLEASGMDLTSLANPVPVTLTIGSNTGTTQVTVSHGL